MSFTISGVQAAQAQPLEFDDSAGAAPLSFVEEATLLAQRAGTRASGPEPVSVSVGRITIRVRPLTELQQQGPGQLATQRQTAETVKARDDAHAYAEPLTRFLELRANRPMFEQAVRAYNHATGARLSTELEFKSIPNPRASAGPRAHNEQVMAELLRAHPGLSGELLIGMARADGYFGSVPHRAWAEAAEARTGGALKAEWWMRFDPFGGTAGNGPNILPQGEHPLTDQSFGNSGVLAKIAMAHDTDWSLGRYFGVGPMAALQEAPVAGVDGARGGHTPEQLGRVGLDPNAVIRTDLYTIGHRDWQITSW